MDINAKYLVYKTAFHLVNDYNYEVVYINGEKDEIWLEQRKKKRLVRIIRKGFDWQNHLRKDIAIVFQQLKNMKKFFNRKNYEIHNIYVSKYSPVDDWEVLKKPMQLKMKKPIKMRVYYFDENNYRNEMDRFSHELGIVLSSFQLDDVDEEAKANNTHSFKRLLIQSIQNKQEEITSIFTYGKPFITYLFIVLNIFMYFLLEVNGGSETIETLIEFGAKYNPAMIENNEWWRIVSSMFIHIGFLHLFMNMIAIYFLGTLIERIYGSWRFLLIYLLSGVGGGIASFAFSVNVSAGASGAIFGLFGAILFFGLIYRQIFLKTIGLNIVIILIINIVFGFSFPQIDMAAHIGGLVSGFIVSAVVFLPKKRIIPLQVISSIGYVFFLLFFITFGYYQNLNHQLYDVMQIEELLEEEKYEEIVEVATSALDKKGDQEGILLFQRSYAYIELGKMELAIKDLNNSISYKALPESYYNLALLYYEQNNMDKAEENIRKAYRLEPESTSVKDLFKEITGESLDN